MRVPEHRPGSTGQGRPSSVTSSCSRPSAWSGAPPIQTHLLPNHLSFSVGNTDHKKCRTLYAPPTGEGSRPFPATLLVAQWLSRWPSSEQAPPPHTRRPRELASPGRQGAASPRPAVAMMAPELEMAPEGAGAEAHSKPTEGSAATGCPRQHMTSPVLRPQRGLAPSQVRETHGTVRGQTHTQKHSKHHGEVGGTGGTPVQQSVEGTARPLPSPDLA